MGRRKTKTGGRAATTGTIPGRYALSVGSPDLPSPAGWRWTHLAEVARLESGHTPSRRRPEYWGGDIPWIGIKDARAAHGRDIQETTGCTNELGIQNSAARVLPARTVCLSRTASIGYVTRMGRPMATSQDFVNWVCDEDLISSRYLMYILLSEVDSLFRFAHGSTHQTIYFPEVKAFHVLLPPLAAQRRIVAVLGALDDKIELNREMNRTLEEMAQALFKSWFIDFDGHDDLVDSELGPIPRGWTVESLDEVAHFLNGAACQRFRPKEGEPWLPVIKIRELRDGISERTDRAGVSIPAKWHIDDGDLLFSWSATLLVKVWTGGRGALNQHLFKVTSERFPRWFCHQWIQYHLDRFQRIAADKATTMGHIKRGHLSQAKVAVPPPATRARFAETLAPLDERRVVAARESRTVAELRDTLLPKLISGELRVPEALDLVEAAT